MWLRIDVFESWQRLIIKSTLAVYVYTYVYLRHAQRRNKTGNAGKTGQNRPIEPAKPATFLNHNRTATAGLRRRYGEATAGLRRRYGEATVNTK